MPSPSRKPALRPPRKLFLLLRFLGIDQNTLAAHLGVSHTLVSLWAHGRKPIPERHVEGIMDLISSTWDQKISAPPESLTKKQIDARIEFIGDFKILVQDWAIERAEASGGLTKELFAHCRTLGDYGTQQSRELSPEDRQTIQTAAEEVLTFLRLLNRLETIPPGLHERLKDVMDTAEDQQSAHEKQ